MLAQEIIEVIEGPGWYDAAFYSAAWAIAAFCGVLSTYIDRHDRDTCELLSIGCVSGWLGAAAIGLLVRTTGGTYGMEPYYFSVGAFVGLLGKKGLYLATWAVNSVFTKLGLPVDAFEQDTNTSRCGSYVVDDSDRASDDLLQRKSDTDRTHTETDGKE